MEVPRTHVKEAVEVGTALQQASRMLAHAQHLAHYDPLTGLCNRVLFGELVLRELAVAQRSGASFAILAIDLDGFKAVNDMHGHAAGDTVLKEAADRMANAIRVSDVAARLGGDEFAILLLAANRESAQAGRGAGGKPVAALCQRQGRGVGQCGHRRLPAIGHDHAAAARARRCGLVPGQGLGKRRVASDVSGRAGAGWRGQLVKLPGFGVPVVRGAGRHERRAAGSRS